MNQPETLPRLVTSLHPLEKRAVLQFTKQILADHAEEIASLSLHSAGRTDARGVEEVEILILTHEDDSALEDRFLDIVADVVVDTGVYLTVRSFSLEAYESFKSLNLPYVSRLESSSVPLFGGTPAL